MPDLDYAKVTGRFGLTVADGPDGDDYPDTIWCDEGSVEIQPLITYTKVSEGVPSPWTAGNSVITATINTQGYLEWNGKPGVWLVDLTSDKVNPQIGPNKATHKITFKNVKAGGTPVNFTSVPVRITKNGALGDGVNDLTRLMPVDPGVNTPIYRGEKGIGVTNVIITPTGEFSLVLTDGTETEPIELPAATDVLDAAAAVAADASTASGAAGTAVDAAASASGDAATATSARAAAEGARDDAITARDAAIDISNITVDDDIVEVLVKNTGGAGPKTAAALAGQFAGIESLPINVRDPEFGAVGDGVTDDTAAVQAAIDAAAGAVEVIVARGTYLVGALTSASGLLLTFEEGASLVLADDTNAPLVTVTAGDRVRIKGGTFDGNKTNNSFGTVGLIDVATVDEVDIDTRINTSGGTGIRVIGANRGHLTPTVLDTAAHGVQVIDSSNLTIRATVDGTDHCGAIVVPSSTDCSNINIEGVYRNVARLGSPHIGIYFNSGDTFIVKRSRISAHLENAGYIGIFPGGDHNTVTGWSIDTTGTVTAPSAHGLRVHDSAHISIGPGVVRGAGRSGVSVDKAHAVTITGVTATQNANAGFLFSRDDTATGRYQGTATNKDLTVAGCIATDNSQAGGNTWPGFYISGYQSLTITGSQAHDYQSTKTQSRGVVAANNASTQDVSIVGCDFRGNISAVGIQIAAAYLSTCYGNTPSDAAFVATGAAQLAAGATEGFHHLPRINGTPTGTPTLRPGGWPAAVDAPGSKLWVYTGAAWKSVALT